MNHLYINMFCWNRCFQIAIHCEQSTYFNRSLFNIILKYDKMEKKCGVWFCSLQSWNITDNPGYCDCTFIIHEEAMNSANCCKMVLCRHLLSTTIYCALGTAHASDNGAFSDSCNPYYYNSTGEHSCFSHHICLSQTNLKRKCLLAVKMLPLIP